MRLNSALHVSIVFAILAVMPVAADEPQPVMAQSWKASRIGDRPTLTGHCPRRPAMGVNFACRSTSLGGVVCGRGRNDTLSPVRVSRCSWRV